MPDPKPAFDLYAKVRHDIGTHGRSIIVVMADRGAPGFCYTIGNHLRGFPELFVFGNSTTGGLLNLWSDMMIEAGKPYVDKSKIDIGGKVPCMAIHCRNLVKQEYTLQATQFLGHEEYKVIQILVPDPYGKYPYDPKCLPRFRTPVLSQPLNN